MVQSWALLLLVGAFFSIVGASAVAREIAARVDLPSKFERFRVARAAATGQTTPALFALDVRVSRAIASPRATYTACVDAGDLDSLLRALKEDRDPLLVAWRRPAFASDRGVRSGQSVKTSGVRVEGNRDGREGV